MNQATREIAQTQAPQLGWAAIIGGAAYAATEFGIDPQTAVYAAVIVYAAQTVVNGTMMAARLACQHLRENGGVPVRVQLALHQEETTREALVDEVLKRMRTEVLDSGDTVESAPPRQRRR